MTKPYSLDLRERVTERVAAGDSVRAVATIRARSDWTVHTVLGAHGIHLHGVMWRRATRSKCFSSI
jgi:hypothetical protein